MSLSQLVVERIYQVEPIWVLIIFCEIFKCFYKLGGMLFHSIGVKRHFSIEGIAPEIFCATRLIYKAKVRCHIGTELCNTGYFRKD